jgi:hypothetical protein
VRTGLEVEDVEIVEMVGSLTGDGDVEFGDGLIFFADLFDIANISTRYSQRSNVRKYPCDRTPIVPVLLLLIADALNKPRWLNES